jgi:hypothetical protein
VQASIARSAAIFFSVILEELREEESILRYLESKKSGAQRGRDL